MTQNLGTWLGGSILKHSLSWQVWHILSLSWNIDVDPDRAIPDGTHLRMFHKVLVHVVWKIQRSTPQHYLTAGWQWIQRHRSVQCLPQHHTRKCQFQVWILKQRPEHLSAHHRYECYVLTVTSQVVNGEDDHFVAGTVTLQWQWTRWVSDTQDTWAWRSFPNMQWWADWSTDAAFSWSKSSVCNDNNVTVWKDEPSPPPLWHSFCSTPTMQQCMTMK